MTIAETAQAPETRAFEADVAKILHLMVHSVYSDRDVFLRELISNAADACEKLRYEAIAAPELLGEDAAMRVTLALDADAKRLAVIDNGIGMSRDEMAQALGTIAHSGTRAFLERVEANKDAANVIGQFGVGFYSAFMVAERVDVVSRRAGAAEAWRWSSDGKGTYTVEAVDLADAPARGTRVELHLAADAGAYAERGMIERLVRERSGHVPVPISIVEKPGAEADELADGAALWTKPKSEITKEAYTDFYRSLGMAWDEPAVTLHYRAEGRQEYTVLAFVPTERPFDLFDADRKGGMKLYVKRVFITDEAELLPRYLRFVRGLVDSADIPLNVSREMIQESALIGAIRKGVTGRVLGELAKLAEKEPEAYAKTWAAFGTVLKEGVYDDFERRAELLALSRFTSTAAMEGGRSLKDYVAAMREGQGGIYYITGDDAGRLAASPQLEGFRARGLEVLLLTDPVDAFWVTANPEFEGKRFVSVTQGAADLAAVPPLDPASAPSAEAEPAVAAFIAHAKATLGDAVSDVRASDRLTDSAVCLVAPAHGPDRQLERLLAGAGRIKTAAKPILEINPRHPLVAALAALPEGAEARADGAWLLFDEAAILDGDKPTDPKAFAERLTRFVTRGLAGG
jgi:molecular chaperone HtpG